MNPDDEEMKESANRQPYSIDSEARDRFFRELSEKDVEVDHLRRIVGFQGEKMRETKALVQKRRKGIEGAIQNLKKAEQNLKAVTDSKGVLAELRDKTKRRDMVLQTKWILDPEIDMHATDILGMRKALERNGKSA